MRMYIGVERKENRMPKLSQNPNRLSPRSVILFIFGKTSFSKRIQIMETLIGLSDSQSFGILAKDSNAGSKSFRKGKIPLHVSISTEWLVNNHNFYNLAL